MENVALNQERITHTIIYKVVNKWLKEIKWLERRINWRKRDINWRSLLSPTRPIYLEGQAIFSNAMELREISPNIVAYLPPQDYAFEECRLIVEEDEIVFYDARCVQRRPFHSPSSSPPHSSSVEERRRVTIWGTTTLFPSTCTSKSSVWLNYFFHMFTRKSLRAVETFVQSKMINNWSHGSWEDTENSFDPLVVPFLQSLASSPMMGAFCVSDSKMVGLCSTIELCLKRMNR